MRRENRKSKDEDKVKWGKLVSFFIAIILLGIAIAMSMSQEKAVGNLNYNKGENNEGNNTWLEQASSSISKDINEVEEESNNLISNAEVDNKEDTENIVNNEAVSTSNNANTNKVENNTTEKQENKETQNESSENNQTKEEEKNTVNFIFPVEGDVIKEYAKDNLIYSETLEEWITHSGIDIKADRASIVKATADGTVKTIKNDPRYGLTVTIEHSDGYVSSYSSLLTAEFVKEGEKVTQGQTIGTVGNSAVFETAEDNHLHFELLKDGSNINPEMYLK